MATVVASETLLTEIEAAKFLNTSPGTLRVWRCTKRHAIPYVKLGSAVRYRLRHLEQYVEKQTVTPAALVTA